MAKKLIPELRFPEFSGEWEETKLGAVLDFKNGLNKDKKYFGHGTPIVNYMDVNKSKHLTKDNIKGLVDVNKSELDRFSVKQGDIFFTRTSETIEEIGVASVIIEDIDSCVYSGFILRGRNRTDLMYDIFSGYYYNTELIRMEIMRKSSKTTRALTNGTLLSEVIINIPEFSEQKKIGDFFFKLDKRIELQRNYVEKLKDKKKGLMQRIFSKEIRFKDENGEVYPEWNEKKFGEISTVNQGLQIPISNRFTEPAPNRYFYLTNEFLKEGSKEKYYIENPPESVICTESDVLMTRTGNTGMVVTDVDGAFHNNFFIINYDKDIITKEFLVLSLKSYYIQKDILIRAGGSTILDINHSEFYKVMIMIPSLPEQDKIANILSKVDEKIELEESLLEKYEDMKKGLMQRMFA